MKHVVVVHAGTHAVTGKEPKGTIKMRDLVPPNLSEVEKQKIYEADARKIFDVLFTTVPGGTLDALGDLIE